MHVDGAALAAVCRRYSVKELSLFGSAVRGEMRAESDVDIMIESSREYASALLNSNPSRRSWRCSPGAESTSLPGAD